MLRLSSTVPKASRTCVQMSMVLEQRSIRYSQVLNPSMLSHVSRQTKEMRHFNRRMYWYQTFDSHYLKLFNALCLFIMMTALLQCHRSDTHCRPILAHKTDQ